MENTRARAFIHRKSLCDPSSTIYNWYSEKIASDFHLISRMKKKPQKIFLELFESFHALTLCSDEFCIFPLITDPYTFAYYPGDGWKRIVSENARFGIFSSIQSYMVAVAFDWLYWLIRFKFSWPKKEKEHNWNEMLQQSSNHISDYLTQSFIESLRCCLIRATISLSCCFIVDAIVFSLFVV